MRAVDCRTGEGTQLAFGRLFGDHGALLPALTGLLTLYVALFAIGMLTGRTRLGAASLTPRMLTLGMVLTFATSWLAYQHVVWTLAIGAPDQLATMIAGTHGSATDAFADKLDMIFTAIADSTKQTPTTAISAAGATANGASPTGISILSAQGLLWISGLMLLVGTVGVLVTAKVALAALLAVGSVFIVLILFPGTRGLFEGWLKAVVSSALVPLFTVLVGGGALTLIAPLIRNGADGFKRGRDAQRHRAVPRRLRLHRADGDRRAHRGHDRVGLAHTVSAGRARRHCRAQCAFVHHPATAGDGSGERAAGKRGGCGRCWPRYPLPPATPLSRAAHRRMSAPP